MAKKKPQSSRRPGRPSSFSLAVANRCIRHFEEGGTRHGLDRDKSLPSWRTWRRWMEGRPELRSRYARALIDQADDLVDEALEAARDATAEDVSAKRVLIDTLLRVAAKRNPKKYSDKLMTEHSGPGGTPIPLTQVQMGKDEAAALYLKMLKEP